MLEPGETDEDGAWNPEELNAMSKEDLILAVWNGKGKGKGKGKGNRSDVRAPPRDVADMTCPNCNKKGHLKGDCTEAKVDLKSRKCFICGAPGCMAKTCPKKGQMAKALTSPGAEAPAWFGCAAGSCIEPAHRSRNQRRTRTTLALRRRVRSTPWPSGLSSDTFLPRIQALHI